MVFVLIAKTFFVILLMIKKSLLLISCLPTYLFAADCSCTYWDAENYVAIKVSYSTFSSDCETAIDYTSGKAFYSYYKQPGLFGYADGADPNVCLN